MESHDEWTGGSDESFLRRVRTNSSDLATTTTPQVSSFDHTLSEKVPNRTAATPLPPSLSEPAPFEHYKLNGGEGFSFSPITGAIVFDNWEDAIGKFTTQGKEGEEEAQELAVEKELNEFVKLTPLLRFLGFVHSLGLFDVFFAVSRIEAVTSWRDLIAFGPLSVHSPLGP